MKSKILECLIWGVSIGVSVVFAEHPANAQPPVTGHGEFWGHETNGIRAGLYITQSVRETNYKVICTPVLRSTNTEWLTVWLPPKESRFRLTLVDGKGNPVGKTPKADALGKPLVEPLRLTTGVNVRAGYSGCVLALGEPQILSDMEFTLDDYFSVTNSGNHRLKFEMQIVWIPRSWTNSLKHAPPPTLALPPVEAEINIRESHRR